MRFKPRTFGLLGRSLKHSFSPQFFNEKFTQEGLPHRYVLLERATLQNLRNLPNELTDTAGALAGFNVTIPYKREILSLLDVLDETAVATGAVNTVAILPSGAWAGFNTDVAGFRQSLTEVLGATACPAALVLGNGGAAAAVRYALHLLQAPGITIVVREKKGDVLLAADEALTTYEQLDAATVAAHPLIINTTPVGMYPHVHEAPPIPYAAITPQHIVFDLIYNPAETLFLQRGRMQGARIQNGLPMLRYQALAAWDIWQQHCDLLP
jgi:shikimate dehydrogenase